jgi:hypothetical protein
MNHFTKIALSGAASLALFTPLAIAQQNATPATSIAAPPTLPNTSGIYSLDEFGEIKTAPQAAYEKAMDAIMASGGGVLFIPGSTAQNWKFSNNTQRTLRNPPPPAPAKQWPLSVGVTVIDTRGGTLKIYPPQMTGLEIDRTYEAAPGQSTPGGAPQPMLDLRNDGVRGSTSYREPLQAPVKAGQDVRFYVPTIRGLFPGMFLNMQGNPGGVVRLYVKSLGYDAEKQMHYIVADTDKDFNGGYLHNKTHINALKMTTTANTELQSFDFMNHRFNYSNGDTTLFDARFNYMGEVHSTGGDENGILYAAFTYSDTGIFQSKVASVNAEKDEVVFSGGNASTLGTGRPLINMNPQKWITGGSVAIVRPASWYETAEERPDLKNPTYQGKEYPTTIRTNPVTGQAELEKGGLIRFSKDAPLTPDVVGRYFAVDEKSELVSGRLHRWYLITSLKTNPDGTKDIAIRRYWWGAKDADAPTLYQEENYTADGHEKPLKYVIAPGSNVYDVTGAVGKDASKHTLLVAPYSDRGSTFDFAAGDAVEQAIGPDPFHPIPFRLWAFDTVPSPFPAPMMDVQGNNSRRSSVFRAAGNNKLGLPVFEDLLRVDASSNNVIDVYGKPQGGSAFLHIEPGNGPAPIVWNYDKGSKEARLSVDAKTRDLIFDGGNIRAKGGLLGSISGTETPAKNRSGEARVPAESTTLDVKFTTAEADGNYAVFVQPNWVTQHAVTKRTAEGFTVEFKTPPPAESKPKVKFNASLQWTLVR